MRVLLGPGNGMAWNGGRPLSAAQRSEMARPGMEGHAIAPALCGGWHRHGSTAKPSVVPGQAGHGG